MSDNITPEIIAKTQTLLSKHIKKPVLTEKLLRKPPFRFIHDVITSVIRETGFLKGLFSMDELNPENIKDKEAKIVFLKKLITGINLSTNAQIDLHPHRITAGLDVVKTNELFQTIAEALDNKIDSTTAVNEILKELSKDTTQTKALKKPQNNFKKDNVQSNPRKATRAVNSKINKDHEISLSSNQKKIKGSEKKEATGSKTNLSSGHKKKILKEPTASNQLCGNPNSDVEKNIIGAGEPSNLPDSQDLTKQFYIAEINHVNEQVQLSHLNNDSAKTLKHNTDKEKDKIKLQDENSMNVDSSLKGTVFNEAGVDHLISQDNNEAGSNHIDHLGILESLPERRGNTFNEGIEPNQILSSSLSDAGGSEVVVGPRTSIRPASSRPGAPRIHDKGLALSSHNDNKMATDSVNFIIDSNSIINDDEESLVTVETALTHMDIDKAAPDESYTHEDQGHLVSQIIETKNELEDTAEDKLGVIRDFNFSWSIQKEYTVCKEVEHLQSALQKLTRSINPLGKLIDFLQQDFDSMQKELEHWTIAYQDLSKKLRNEEQITMERMQPLIRNLEDINQLIQEQLDESTMVKAMIINNDGNVDKQLMYHSIHHTFPIH